MSATSAISSRVGNQAKNQAGATFPQIGETNRRVINLIKDMYAEAAVVFGRWIGVSDKTAKRKLKFERTLDIEELGILIRSEQGYKVLEAVMGDARPLWWRVIVPLMDAAEARQMQIAARRRMKQTIESALDADRSLTAAISFAEALSDQDHAGPYLDGLRSMGRVSHRTVAQKRTR